MKNSTGRFMPRMHQNALRDPLIPTDTKNKFGVTCPSALFVESEQVPSEHEKQYIVVLRLARSRMHYVTR
jgi:hypothetical protein